jgi:hypothetical protein
VGEPVVAVAVGMIVEKVIVIVAVQFGVHVFVGPVGAGPGPDKDLEPQAYNITSSIEITIRGRKCLNFDT